MSLSRFRRKSCFFFRTESSKGNPEGRSILRNAYRSWYFKRRIQEIEGIGIERDLAGFPVLTAPEGTDIWDQNDPEMVAILNNAQAIVQNIRRDHLEACFRSGLEAGTFKQRRANRQFDTEQGLLTATTPESPLTVMADFVLLGHQQTGSFALSDNKTHIFSMAIEAFLDVICEQFNNKAIPDLMKMNGEHFRGSY